MNCQISRLPSLFLAFNILCACSLAADWPQWGGRHSRNMVSNETDLPDAFEAGEPGHNVDVRAENIKWVARLGTYAYGNPTVSGDRLFVGTDDLTISNDPRLTRTRAGMVKCFDKHNGELLWQLATPRRDDLRKEALYGHQHLGTCSSPAAVGDRVFVVSSANEVLCLDVNGMADGNDGAFQDEGRYMAGPGRTPVKIEPHDADIIWRFDMVERLGVVPHDAASGSPLVHNGYLYVGTSNGVDKPHTKVLAPHAPSLIVLKTDTGQLIATDNELIGARLWHAQWSSPSLGLVAGRPLVFFGGGDGVCYAFEAVSKVEHEPYHLTKVWSYDCNPPRFRFRDGKPIPYYDGDKRKRRGNIGDGKYLGPSQIIATPTFHDNRVYVAIGQDPAHGRGRGLLHCIDATKTGDITETGKIWSYEGLDRTISTVTVSNGLAYCPDIAGRLHCLTADKGEVLWVHEMIAETWGSPLVADGKIYLGNKRKFLIFAEGREANLLDESRLSAPVYGSAIASDGVIYIASQRHLWAVANE
jgi:outer membrane protein assembly factor BamB